MPRVREVKIKEFSELPYYLSINNIVDDMGFSRQEVDSWFRDSTFPFTNAGVQKVDKYSLRQWLNTRKGNSNATYVTEVLSDKLLEQLMILNDNLKNIHYLQGVS